MNHSHVLLSALLLPLVACEPAVEACEAALSYEPSVQLGIGENEFVSLESGDRVPFHSGAQGGQHVFAAVQTQGLVPGRSLIMGGVNDGVSIDYTLYTEDAEFGWGGGDDLAMSGTDEEAELVGRYVYVEFWDLYQAVEGEDADWDSFDYYDTETPATLEVELTDSCGTTVTDSRDVLLIAYGS